MANAGAILKDKGTAVITTSSGTSLLNAVRLMIEKKVGALLVTNKEEIVGMFTERDFLRASMRTDKSLVELTVAEFMTTELVIVTADLDINDCLSVMTQKRCRHLPVMDQGKLIGMISIGDIGKWISRERATEIQYLTEYIQGRW
jgi:CBS domain-containing protein